MTSKRQPPRHDPADLIALERDACLVSFSEFVRQAWLHADATHTGPIAGLRLLDPSKPEGPTNPRTRLPRYMHALCIHMQAWIEGVFDLGVINLPPGMGKSVVGSVLLPAWCWARDPSEPQMYGSYSEDPSERDSDRNKRLVQSSWYQERFVKRRVRGPWSLVKDTTDIWTNTAGGSRLIVTRSGRGTAFRALRIVVDDGIKVSEGSSEAALAATIEWLSQTLMTRAPIGQPVRMLIIGQRVVDGDPSGWALGTGRFLHLCLPAEHELDRHCQTAVIDPETGAPWQDWRTEPDELLFAELQTREFLAQQKDLLQSGYWAQYQQDPVDPRLSMFPRASWRFYRRDDEPELTELERLRARPKGCWQGPAVVLPPLKELLYVISMDASFKKHPNSDRVSIVVWAKRKKVKVRGRFLLDRRTRQMTFTESVKEVKGTAEDWPDYHVAMIEEKANGSAILDVLEEEGELSRINPPEVKELVNPTDGKPARAAAGAPEMQGGHWFLPEGAPWLTEFVMEHERFPKGRKDDDVDSTSQANTYLRGKSGAKRDAWGDWARS